MNLDLYLAKMTKIMEEYRSGKTELKYPERIKDNVHAQAFYGVVSAILDEVIQLSENRDIVANLSADITEIIKEYSKVDWTSNIDIHKKISHALDDLLYDYASFKASKLFYLYFGWNPDGVGTRFRYGCEEIPVYIYFNKYYFNNSDHKLSLYRRRTDGNNGYRLGSRGHFKSLSFFGKLSWDSERKMSDAVPLIITNME